MTVRSVCHFSDIRHRQLDDGARGDDGGCGCGKGQGGRRYFCSCLCSCRLRFSPLRSASGRFISSTSSRIRSGPMTRVGIFMMPRYTAVRTMTCRASCAGLPPISACTTFIIYAAGSLITGCDRCYGITHNSPPLDGSRCSKAFDVCARFYGMRGGVSSFLFAKWRPTRRLQGKLQ
jgi:hypothetical protein